MKCFRCRANNNSELEYCQQCGAPLRIRRSTDRFKKRKLIMIVAVLILWIGGFAYMFRDSFFSSTEATSQISSEDLKKKRDLKLAKRRELQQKLRAANANDLGENNDSQAEQNIGLPSAEVAHDISPLVGADVLTGWVTVVDKWGHQVTKLRASVTAEGWLALPSRACYGGWTLIYHPDTGGQYEMLKGRWQEDNLVGLWQVNKPENGALKGLAVGKWDERQLVSWYSIETLKELQAVSLAPVRGGYRGDLVEVTLPDSIVEAGLFVQKDKVVGWSFGEWLFNGYLWIGNGKDISSNTKITDFYRTTFSGGREEKLAEALSLIEKSNAINMVTLLVDALLAPPKLHDVDTPYYLQTSAALKVLRKFVNEAVRAGNGRNILAILNNDILLELGDIDLFLSILPAVTANQGFAVAVENIESTGSAIVAKGKVDVPTLNEQHLLLYQDWLQSLVTVNAMGEAWQVLNKGRAYYPEDAYLYLLGVELELMDGNWQKAEQLLYGREYPPSFQDRYQLLAQRISEAKSAEGKIIIEFTPNSNKISVNSNLNGSLAQGFLVDTGASMVTIPSEAAEALRLEVVPGYHGGQRMVSTAGGVVSAEEVVISSLEIGGWIEYNVKALVLDIPDQPGVGLLGLNYLGRFQMDLRNNEGVLLLSPR